MLLAILTGVRWNLRVVLICISWWLRMLNIFSGASQPLGILQVRILCLALSPIFNGVIWFSVVHLLDFFIYIGYQSPLWFRIGKDPFPICWLPCCPIDGVCCLTEALQFHEVPFVNSWSYSTNHCCSTQEFFPCAHIFYAFPHFLLYKFHWLWLYVEFLDPLRFDLSTRR